MPLVPSLTILPAANVDASFVGINVGTDPSNTSASRVATTVVGSKGCGTGGAQYGSTAG